MTVIKQTLFETISHEIQFYMNSFYSLFIAGLCKYDITVYVICGA